MKYKMQCCSNTVTLPNIFAEFANMPTPKLALDTALEVSKRIASRTLCLFALWDENEQCVAHWMVNIDHPSVQHLNQKLETVE